MKNSVLIKIFAIICILCMSLAICACGGNQPEHTHKFVEGKCSCGEFDPSYKPAHTHSYVNGKCECGEFDPDFDINDLDKPGNNDKPDGNTVTYTVTVVDQNGAPVAGVHVQICDGNLCQMPVPTNENGVVTCDLDVKDYSVKLLGLSGYTYEAEYHFAAGSTELTITVTAK